MKVIRNILAGWGYPVLNNPKELNDNAYTIVWELFTLYGDKPFQLISIGASGAMILTAVSMFNQMQNSVLNMKPVLLRRETDKRAHRDHFERVGDDPIIIIDDHICKGYTLSEIRSILGDYRAQLVEGMIMLSWNNNPSFEDNKQKMLKIFPTTKFWIS